MTGRMYVNAISLIAACLIVSTFLASIAPLHSLAQVNKDAIQEQIDARNRAIADLEKDIAKYQFELQTLNGQSRTLQTAISSLNVSRNQATKQIQVTQNRMDASSLTLQRLSGDITQKEYEIALDTKSLANSIREMYMTDGTTLIEQVLASDSISDAWTATDSIASVGDALRANAASLASVKKELGAQHDQESSERDQLTRLNTDLAAQKKQLDIAKAEKDKLLSATKSQESSYQTLIAQKRAEQASFQSELFRLSEQLKAADTTTIPSAGTGVLAYPLSSPTVTQYFGRTSDSGRLYASGTHDGVDFAAAIGTPIKAALGGTVYATNEGAVQNCQYGKWVIVKHANGLATLYAHLSQISVSSGQTVSTGEVLGYSGMTGYATGPHLHFTVYVASSVTLKQYTCKSGPTVTIPIAPPNGYLNPMSYL